MFHRYQVDVVFHLASYGMSGREMVGLCFVWLWNSYVHIYSTIRSFLQLKKRVIEEVNIEGTKNVIRGIEEKEKIIAMVTTWMFSMYGRRRVQTRLHQYLQRGVWRAGDLQWRLHLALPACRQTRRPLLQDKEYCRAASESC